MGKFRQIVPTKKMRVDPRFDAKSGGDFDDIQFRKDYGFISEIKNQEISVNNFILNLLVLRN